MKKSALFLTFLLTVSFGFHLSGKQVVLYQIMKNDADELNKLAGSLGISGTGWPVNDSESTKSLNVWGVSFVLFETAIRYENTDTITVLKHKTQELIFYNTGLSGSIPEISFEELLTLSMSYNNISGSLPTLTCPKLLVLDLKSNKISGSIPSFNLPRCTDIDLSYNQLTGPLPNFNLGKLVRLHLQYNQLSGSIPDLSLPVLKSLNLMANDLSGEVSGLDKLPNLETLKLDGNEFTALGSLNLPKLIELSAMVCKFTGSLPAFELPSLKILDLTLNEFSGKIPVFVLPNLETLKLCQNKLTGTIPNFSMPKLANLHLYSNALTGGINFTSLPALKQMLINDNKLDSIIKNLNFPELVTLDLYNNSLKGPLPAINLPKISSINLSNNMLSGIIPDLNCPYLNTLNLSYNQFSGKFPVMNCQNILYCDLKGNKLEGDLPVLNFPKVQYFYVGSNKLTGKFDNSLFTKLQYLGLAFNLFEELPALKSGSPTLKQADAGNCRFTFEDIEPNLTIANFYYKPQDSVFHYLINDKGISKLYVKVGGTANKYQWRKKINGVWDDVSGADKDTLITTINEGEVFTCQITNTIATQLTLFSRIGKSPSCISIGTLELCTENGPWKSEGKNELSSTGKVSINDLLVFEGTLKVDTSLLKVTAEGEFYIMDIPLPGGNSVGKYCFSKGKYELTLIGKEGVITDFLNAEIKEHAELLGFELKLKDLTLVGGRKATGIKMDCKITIPGIAGACAETDETKTEIDLKGITVTTSGISLSGIEIADLGLFIKDYCLKKLNVSYEAKEDILEAGATVKLPFGEVGGGFKLANGYLDNLSWRLEAEKPPFVLGTTTIGIKGFFGQISHITDPEIEIELGGIFSDIISDRFYIVEASGRTVWPSLFEVKGSGKFMKPPFIQLPYQINGEVTMSYDHPLQMFAIGFDGKIGTEDEKDWLLNTKGNYKMSVRYSPPKFAGEVEGSIKLPKFSSKFPYNWLNSMFTFPIEGNTQATFIWANSKLLHGTATFSTATRGPYSLRYVINFEKEFGSDDFLWFETKVTTKSASLKRGDLSGESVKEIVIPANTDFAVVGIISAVKAATSTLKNPSGKIFSTTSDPDNLLYTASADSKETFWTIKNPQAGNWELSLTNPAAGDSVILFIQPKTPDFKISFVQDGKKVTASWNPAPFGSKHKISLLLDNDNTGFDGFGVAEGFAASGTLTFQTNDSLTACSYYLFAQISDETSTVKAYADNLITNVKAILLPPAIVSAGYSSISGTTLIQYGDNNDPHTAGYILTVTDKQGKDSIFAMMNRGNGVIELVIPAPASSTLKMTSYGFDGLTGCPSVSKSIVTGIQKEKSNNQNILSVYPNPTTGKVNIRYSLIRDSQVECSVVDLYGRKISLISQERNPAGTYTREWNFGSSASGMYFITLKTESGIYTVPCILRH